MTATYRERTVSFSLQASESPDIFHKYNDYGDRIKRHAVALETIPDEEPPEQIESPSKKVVQIHTPMMSVEPLDVVLKTPLPDIGVSISVTEGTFIEDKDGENKAPNPTSENEESNLDRASAQEYGNDNESNVDGNERGRESAANADNASNFDAQSTLFELTKVSRASVTEPQTEPEAPDEIVDFREAPISPVPTPHLFRPETRESGRVSIQEKVQKVLQGHINVKVEPDFKLVRIYLHSHFTGKQGSFWIWAQPRRDKKSSLIGWDNTQNDP